MLHNRVECRPKLHQLTQPWSWCGRPTDATKTTVPSDAVVELMQPVSTVGQDTTNQIVQPSSKADLSLLTTRFVTGLIAGTAAQLIGCRRRLLLGLLPDGRRLALGRRSVRLLLGLLLGGCLG